MEWFKKFIHDNVFIIGFFIAASATWVIYEKQKSNNGLPSCTDARIKNMFADVVLDDLLSVGFMGPRPEVYDFKSISYDENANYCQATISLTVGGTGNVLNRFYKVYRSNPNSSSYSVGFVQPGD